MSLSANHKPREAPGRQSPAKPRRAVHTRLQVEALEERTLPSINLVEIEPNNTMAASQVLSRVLDVDVIVAGQISVAGDRDWFRVDLQAGDVIGAALAGQSGLNPAMRLVDSSGRLLVSNDDAGFVGNVLPPESPLPRDQSHGQNAELYYVISTPGTYFIEVAASADASAGTYKLDLVVARPGLEKQPVGTKQILFLDFDGAAVNFSQFADPSSSAGVSGTKRLSPLSNSLSTWGLTAADENAVIDAVVAKVRENLSQDVRLLGRNGDFASSGIPGQFDIDIRNSRDHADEFGKNPFVSRVVVGGTAAEAGFGDAAGLAQFIDPGNFSTDDDAVATVDPFVNGLLDRFSVAPPLTRIDLIGLIVGNLVSHEAGHFFGNFHTDRSLTDVFVGTPSIMDHNGFNVRSLGPDAVLGTADDVDVDLGVDDYSHTERFLGLEDTLNTVSFGLSTGKQLPAGASSASFSTSGSPSSGQTNSFLFTVTLSAAYDQAVTMSFRTVDGTATTSDNDYVAKSRTLTFNPGATTKTITIEVKGDNKMEADETFYLDLFGNSSNALFTKKLGLGTIRNDD